MIAFTSPWCWVIWKHCTSFSVHGVLLCAPNDNAHDDNATLISDIVPSLASLLPSRTTIQQLEKGCLEQSR